MRYLAFEVPDEYLDRVILLARDPRDGPVTDRPLASGSAMQTVLGLLPVLSPEELNALKRDLILPIQRKALAERQARLRLAAEEAGAVVAPDESAGAGVGTDYHRTGVVVTAGAWPTQADFDAAVAEEQVESHHAGEERS